VENNHFSEIIVVPHLNLFSEQTKKQLLAINFFKALFEDGSRITIKRLTKALYSIKSA
jgi:hypothetical protein